MNVNFTYSQAKAFAEMTGRAWKFILALRADLDIPLGKPFDWADAVDILNGYGYGEVASSDLIVEDVVEEGDIVLVRSNTSFQKKDVAQSLQLLSCEFWMWKYAVGFTANEGIPGVTPHYERNLTTAYKYRREFFSILGNIEW